MKKRRYLTAILITMSLFALALAFYVNANEGGFVATPVVTNPAAFIDSWVVIDNENIIDAYQANRTLARGEAIEFSFNVPTNGQYHIAMRYRLAENLVTRSSVTLRIGEDVFRAPVHGIWMEYSKDHPRTRFGHHFLSEQLPVEGYHIDFLRNDITVNKNPFAFSFTEGNIELSITSDTQDIIILEIYLVQANPLSSTSDHIPSGNFGTDRIAIDGENFDIKSASYIVPLALRNPNASSFNNRLREFNAVALNRTGQAILWNFTVENPGYYRIGLQYLQRDMQGVPLFIDIELNGQPIYQELNGYALPFTGRNLNQHIIEDAWIWLDAGTHTITIRQNAHPVENIIQELRQIINEMNFAGIELRQLAGTNIDINRTWDMHDYMPEIFDLADGWISRIQEQYENMGQWTDRPPAGAVVLSLAADSLIRLMEHPERIPARRQELNEGAGSSAQMLGNFINSIEHRTLTIDRIFIFGEGNLPNNRVSIWRRLFNAIDNFFFSFSPDARVATTLTASDGVELNIWSGGGTMLVETVQQMADIWFTPQTGIPVRISAQGDESKFILATAAGMPPDGAINIHAHIPFQLALRNALEPLSQFEDFEAFARANINPDTLTPFILGGEVYAITDRMDFFVTMYRQDILEHLRLEVPQTWDDVIDMMPTLRRNGMNFYTPMSQAGPKFFPATLPFFFQHGANLYSWDGMRTEIDSERGVAAFNLMTELFTLYGMDPQVANFYQDFRSGTIPIGVSNFQHYMMITNAAGELAGSWNIAPPPGIMDEFGVIHNQHPVALSASIIARGGQPEATWEFIKWFMSAETQALLANMLQNRFGPEVLYNTANIHAFAQIPFNSDHKQVMLESWENIQQAEEHPARYMLEREISNAWIATVVDGTPARVALDRAVINVNREITRRMEDFGLTQFNMYNIWDVFERD